jgi:hypothetical protein
MEMREEHKIKGILVNFFRQAADKDYLDALNNAVKEIEQLTTPVDVEQREQLKPLPPNECDMCGTLIDPRLTNCGGCGL